MHTASHQYGHWGRRAFVSLACVLGVGLAGAAMSPPAAAQTTTAPTAETRPIKPVYAMVVDVQHVMQRASASASLQRQIDQQREAYQGEIARLENELRQAERALQEQRTLIERDEFDRRRREFEKRVAEVQSLVQNRRQVLEKAYGTANTRIRSTMLTIIAEIAEREQVVLVLSKQQVVMVDRSLERTEAVLQALNERLPDVKVTLE